MNGPCVGPHPALGRGGEGQGMAQLSPSPASFFPGAALASMCIQECKCGIRDTTSYPLSSPTRGSSHARVGVQRVLCMGCVIPLIFFRSEHSCSREEGRKEKTFCDGAKQGSALERGGGGTHRSSLLACSAIPRR